MAVRIDYIDGWVAIMDFNEYEGWRTICWEKTWNISKDA